MEPKSKSSLCEDFLWDDGGSMCTQVKIPPPWGLFFETANASCHDPWRVVSHVTPVTLPLRILDPYWVTLWKLLMWLPQAMYVVSHAKGTSLSQTINFGTHLSFFCGALTSLSHLPNFFCVSGTHYSLALLLHSHDLALCPCLSVEVATRASYFGQQTIFGVI